MYLQKFCHMRYIPWNLDLGLSYPDYKYQKTKEQSWKEPWIEEHAPPTKEQIKNYGHFSPETILEQKK